MTQLIAIGAGIAVLTGIGAGIGIGLATSKSSGCNRKTAGSRTKDQSQLSAWLCISRGNCYLWFRYCLTDHIDASLIQTERLAIQHVTF